MRKARAYSPRQMFSGWPARVVRAFWRLAGYLPSGSLTTRVRTL
jgi:hypothetical protein